MEDTTPVTTPVVAEEEVVEPTEEEVVAEPTEEEAIPVEETPSEEVAA